jgi:DNA polymerase family B
MRTTTILNTPLYKTHYFSIALARPSLFSTLTARDKNIKQKVLNNTNNSLELTENDNISLDISNVKSKSPSNYLEIDEEKVMYDRAVKNFIKLVTKDQFNTTLNNYKVLLAFLKKFDSNIHFSLGSFHNYRNRDTKFKPFIITNRIKNLIKYIQKFDKDFNHNMINVNNSSNVKSNKKSVLDHNIIPAVAGKTTTSILNVKSNKNLDYHLPHRAVYKRSYTMSHTTGNNDKLALIPTVYADRQLSLILYTKPQLSLILYKNHKLSLIPTVYIEPRLSLILYTNPQVSLILYSDPQITLMELFNVRKSKYGWNTWNSELYHSFITAKTLRTDLTSFWDFLYPKDGNNDAFFAILFKIKFKDTLIKTVSTTQIANKNGFEKIFEIFSKVFNVESLVDFISDTELVIIQTKIPYGQIMFDFKYLKNIKNTKYEHYNLLTSDDIITQKTKKFKTPLNESLNLYKYKKYAIPMHMDLWLWPNIRFSNDYRNAYSSINIADNNNDYTLHFLIYLNDDNYSATVWKDKTILFTFIDYMKNCEDLSDFKRVIKDNEDETHLYYQNGKLKLYTKKIKTKFIEVIAKDKKKNNKILTLDFETRDISTSHTNEDAKIVGGKVPVAISLDDGRKRYSSVFENINTWQDELCTFLKENLLKRKYDYYKVYIHNASYFDYIFMIDTLTKLGDVKILPRDNKILKITLKYTPNNNSSRKCTLIFYDSMLILQTALRDLPKGFNMDIGKDYFPFGFMNYKEVDFNYRGPVPKIEDFLGKISPTEYKKYCENHKNKEWVFKDELIKYCELDTIVLYKILEKFNDEIYSMFKIDFTKYPTLPALSFAIYRSNYMPKDTIPKIIGTHHYTLKQAYYGGITEAYKPYGRSIKSYDVNSLYPSVMHDYEMPVGIPYRFIGDITLMDKNIPRFGSFRARIKTPLDIKCPPLPVKFKTREGKRTIFPVGEWEGWYVSEELKNKIKYGYEVEILEGYLFDKKNIFSDFIKDLYKIKSTYDSTNPKYQIAKLLMNSLYGRFGLNPEERETEIVSSDESDLIIANKKQVTITPLLSGSVIISYDKDSEDVKIDNISVSISSFISAYSRNVMTHYLMKYADNLYAIDTDGIKIFGKLSDTEIDNKKLGKMKYEYEFYEGVFPAPKIYGGILTKPYKKYEKELVKVKGLKNPLEYLELKALLKKDTVIKKEQEKWIRKISESIILIRKEIYTLTIKESKRKIIYDEYGWYRDTTPFILKDNKIVNETS